MVYIDSIGQIPISKTEYHAEKLLDTHSCIDGIADSRFGWTLIVRRR